MASTLLMEISQDERERAHYRSRRMYETDRTSDELTIKYKEALRIARNMKAENEPNEKIVRFTELTLSEVENA